MGRDAQLTKIGKGAPTSTEEALHSVYNVGRIEKLFDPFFLIVLHRKSAVYVERESDVPKFRTERSDDLKDAILSCIFFNFALSCPSNKWSRYAQKE
jgi:hypothetical protein